MSDAAWGSTLRRDRMRGAPEDHALQQQVQLAIQIYYEDNIIKQLLNNTISCYFSSCVHMRCKFVFMCMCMCMCVCT